MQIDQRIMKGREKRWIGTYNLSSNQSMKKLAEQYISKEYTALYQEIINSLL